jgi:hypothetical protein
MRWRGWLICELNEDLHDLPLLFATTLVEATPLRLSLQVGDIAHTIVSDDLQQFSLQVMPPSAALVLARVTDHRHGPWRTVDLPQCVELGSLSKN